MERGNWGMRPRYRVDMLPDRITYLRIGHILLTGALIFWISRVLIDRLVCAYSGLSLVNDSTLAVKTPTSFLCLSFLAARLPLSTAPMC